MHVFKPFLWLPLIIALAFLLTGCASITRPLALPVPVVAPQVQTPIPPDMLRLPDKPDPLAPGYSRTH